MTYDRLMGVFGGVCSLHWVGHRLANLLPFLPRTAGAGQRPPVQDTLLFSEFAPGGSEAVKVAGFSLGFHEAADLFHSRTNDIPLLQEVRVR